MLRVGFDQTAAVPDDLLMVEMNAIAGQANDTFDVSLADIFRVEEGHDIAMLQLAIGQDVGAEGTGLSESHAVHQHVVADTERAFHRAGGNHVGLHQGRGDEEIDAEGDRPFGDEASGSRLAAGGPDGGGAFVDRGGEKVGHDMDGETDQVHTAGSACQVAAAVAENLLHSGAVLQAKVAGVRVQKE